MTKKVPAVALYKLKEVQIIVKGGWVQCIHNWPEGLPGAVYDYDDAETAEEARIPIEHFKMAGETQRGQHDEV